MKQLQVFTHEMFGKIRVMLVGDEPKFNLYDLGFALGYTKQNDRGATFLRKDLLANTCESLGINGVSASDTREIYISKDIDFENTYISEESLYDLILESKAKHAREVRKWVTGDILPTIRKTGGYVANEDLFIKTYLPHADEATQLLFKATLETVRKQNEKIAVLQPKADYFDALVDRNLLTNFRDTAKELRIKERAFIDWLLERKYIYRDQKGNIRPYAQYVPELFNLKEWERNGKTGSQTLVTPRGRETFRLLLNATVS